MATTNKLLKEQALASTWYVWLTRGCVRTFKGCCTVVPNSLLLTYKVHISKHFWTGTYFIQIFMERFIFIPFTNNMLFSVFFCVCVFKQMNRTLFVLCTGIRQAFILDSWFYCRAFFIFFSLSFSSFWALTRFLIRLIKRFVTESNFRLLMVFSLLLSEFYFSN